MRRVTEFMFAHLSRTIREGRSDASVALMGADADSEV